MDYITAVMYFKKVNDKIECIKEFGDQLEKKRRFIVTKFETDQKIIKLALNKKETYIMLNSGVVLVFKDNHVLKDEIFKSLDKEVKIAKCKYKLKKLSNEIKYNLCKNIDSTKVKAKKIAATTKYALCKNMDPKKVTAIVSAATILTAEAITISVGKMKININSKNIVVDDNMEIQPLSIEELLTKNVNTLSKSDKNVMYSTYDKNMYFADYILDVNQEISEISNNNSVVNNSSESNINSENNNSNSNSFESNINSENNNSNSNSNSSESNINSENNNNSNSSESNINSENSNSFESNNDNSIVFYDEITTPDQVANTFDYYSGEIYGKFVDMMNSSQITSELNSRIGKYVSKNLAGTTWGNASGKGYNNYTIPEKFKNGTYTLNELFDAASEQFGVPKDILVSISQHECSQAYLIKNSYTGIYERNCGGMMGHINLYNMISDHLPNGGYDGCDVSTNPAISVYTYASTIKFFYDSFKDIDIGYGLDPWDISSYMVALGLGNVTNPNVGFKYRYDYDIKGISQLNECVPQFKALREAYLNNELGVNDLTFTVENGVVTHWADGEKFYYKNGEFTFNKFDSSNSSVKIY